MKNLKITLAAIAAVVSINTVLAQNVFPTGAGTKVGIGTGTTAPSTPLHIKSTTDEILRLETPDATLGFMYTGWYNGATRRAWTGLNGTSFNFNVENGTNKFLFNGGDVSIGSATAPNSLNVSGNTSITGNITSNSHLMSINNTTGGDPLNPTAYNAGARYHLYNGSGVAEWFMGQKTVDNNSFIISKKVGTTETDYFTISKDGDIVLSSVNKSTWIKGGLAVDGGYLSGNDISIVGTGVVKIGAVMQKTGYKLFVEDGILTEKVKIAVATSANWADYVFASDYKLMPLTDVENFIKTNNHLPNVPSAKEMVQEGNDLGKTDAKLLEKIEELTLYMIEMMKENEMMKKEIELLKTAKK